MLWVTVLAVMAAVVVAIAGSTGGHSRGTPAANATSATEDRVPAPVHPAGVDWPIFGRVPERRHYLPADLDPPVKQVWSYNDRALIEFPPALANGILYVANQYGDVRALRASDGKTIWDLFEDHRLAGRPVDVTAPAFSSGRLYVARKDGLLVSLDAVTGKPV